jgi:hypothetical protein
MECEVPSVYRVTDRTARKRHRCCECNWWIDPGEKYVECFGIWDGNAETNRQHVHCADACRFIRDHFNAKEPWDERCIGFGMLLDWCCEFGGDEKKDWPKAFRSLIAKARNGYRKWRAGKRKAAKETIK